MAKFIIGRGAIEVSVNSVDLTSHVQSVTTGRAADDHDVTGLDADAHEHLLGLSEDSCTLNFWQDFEAASVDATLSPLQGSNTAFPVVVDIVGVKTLTMQCLLPEYQDLAGAAGEPSATECSFVCGDGNGWVEGESSSGSGSGA